MNNQFKLSASCLPARSDRSRPKDEFWLVPRHRIRMRTGFHWTLSILNKKENSEISEMGRNSKEFSKEIRKTELFNVKGKSISPRKVVLFSGNSDKILFHPSNYVNFQKCKPDFLVERKGSTFTVCCHILIK